MRPLKFFQLLLFAACLSVPALARTDTVALVAGGGHRVDGGLATQVRLVNPFGVGVDAVGNLYILERSGSALRVVDPSGAIRTLIGAPGHSLPPEIGDLNGPKHLCIDRQDRVIIADTENHRILRFDPRTGQTEQIVGTGRAPVAGAPASAGIGGTPRAVNLNQPHGVYVNADGTLYVADSTNGRVLRIQP